MSNNPVDRAINPPLRDEGKEKKSLRDSTLVVLRIKKDQVPFFRRMINHFYENNYINEPKLSHLAKACLNIVGNKFAKVEEITYANYVQKQLARARGTNAPSVGYGELNPQQYQMMDESFKR